MSYSEILYPLGANNTSLTVDNTQPRGLGWIPGGGGGGINAVNPGNNIDVNTVAGVATVSLENPLTAPLNIGTQQLLGNGVANIVIVNDDPLVNSQVNIDADALVIDKAFGPDGNLLSMNRVNGLYIQNTAGDATTFNTLGINKLGANPIVLNTQTAGANINFTTNAGIITTNTPFQPASIRDSVGLLGANNQVLTAGAGGSILWQNGGGGGGITAVNPGNNIDVNTVGGVATVSLKAPLTTNLDMGAVDITTSTVNGQIEMVLNGDGRFVVSQNSAGGDNLPAMTIQNQNGNANEVHIDLYKNSASPAIGDGIGAISFHANNSVGGKQQFALIQANCLDPTQGSPNGSVSFSTVSNSTVQSEYLRINGGTDRVESYKNIDMIGVAPVIMGSTAGNLSLNTSSSSGAGSITVQSKGILQLTAPTSLLENCNAFSLTATTQSVINCPTQILNGSVSTPSLDMIYRATLQPDLTTASYTLNPAIYSANGQGITLINNTGNGSNDLQTIQTTGFSITTQTYSTLFFGGNGGFLVSGYNTATLTAEIRMGSTMANILSNDPNQYTYIILGQFNQANANFVNAVWFSATHQPDIAIFGGSFVMSAGSLTGNGPVNVFPSPVSNILVINTGLSNGLIFPYDMLSAGFYGFNGTVRCFAEIPMSGIMINGSPSSELYVAIGGDFLDTTPPFGGNPLAGIARIRIDILGNNAFAFNYLYGLITFQLPLSGVNFLGVSTSVGSQDINSYLIAGGNFVGSGYNWSGDYLIATSWNFWDSGQGAWTTNWFANEAPYNSVGSYITAGAPANPATPSNTDWIFSIFNTSTQLFDTIKKTIDIGFASNSIAIIEAGHPSGVFSYAMDITNFYPLSLKYAIGGSFRHGSTPFCYEFATPAYVNLNGTTNFGNNAFQVASGDWWFFRDPETAGNTGNDNYTQEIPNVVSPVEINTNGALPFVNYLTPTVLNEKITLGTTNNFALGTYVGHGTNDRRILIHTHNGATFTN